MKKIKEYLVVEGIGVDKLSEQVRLFMQDGWEPIGGVAVVKYMQGLQETVKAFQAVVKYE